ncbi:hypothetical protein CRE_27500 [Caenorhabditis remanei]|uniref:BPTI/Kunitz inhibitor domain-containing protein n=1 Tax=Caenorhabditis remanei TaxID=31234 RepID=E3LNZ3_CAERE|nr:hypothetical protein CRE_27500 [Caenorhabditis remanei]
MMILSILLALLSITHFANAEWVRPAACVAPLVVGSTPCSAEAPVRHFYDTEKDRCYAFRYTGCGGNANNFETKRQCEKICTGDPNRVMCPGSTKPTLNVLGKTSPCGNPNNTEGLPECVGADFYRDLGTNFCHDLGAGQCCAVESISKLASDFWLFECPDGRTKYAPPSNNTHFKYEKFVLGKNCDTNFCPDGYECVMGNYYSFCCK